MSKNKEYNTQSLESFLDKIPEETFGYSEILNLPFMARRLIKEQIAYNNRLGKALIELVREYQMTEKNNPLFRNLPTPEVTELFEVLAGNTERQSKEQRLTLELMRASFYSGQDSPVPLPPIEAYGDDVFVDYNPETKVLKLTTPLMITINTPKGSHYLGEKIAYAMSEFTHGWAMEHNQIIHYGKAAVIFSHHREKRLGGDVRDYDNLERKVVLNAPQTGMLFSDNPDSLTLLETTVISNENYTEICICPDDNLIEVLGEIRSKN